MTVVELSTRKRWTDERDLFFTVQYNGILEVRDSGKKLVAIFAEGEWLGGFYE